MSADNLVCWAEVWHLGGQCGRACLWFGVEQAAQSACLLQDTFRASFAARVVLCWRNYVRTRDVHVRLFGEASTGLGDCRLQGGFGWAGRVRHS